MILGRVHLTRPCARFTRPDALCKVRRVGGWLCKVCGRLRLVKRSPSVFSPDIVQAPRGNERCPRFCLSSPFAEGPTCRNGIAGSRRRRGSARVPPAKGVNVNNLVIPSTTYLLSPRGAANPGKNHLVNLGTQKRLSSPWTRRGRPQGLHNPNTHVSLANVNLDRGWCRWRKVRGRWRFRRVTPRQR